MSKYNNKTCVYQGIEFDSQMEKDYYLNLIQLQGYDIEEIKVHPRFELIPAFEYDGKKIRKMEYEADFQVGDRIIDVKGFLTADFKIKAKLFKYQNPSLKLELITYVKKYGGWITLEQLNIKIKGGKNK